jgi:hypothetical protein
LAKCGYRTFGEMVVVLGGLDYVGSVQGVSSDEDEKHFMMECPAYQDNFEELYNDSQGDMEKLMRHPKSVTYTYD